MKSRNSMPKVRARSKYRFTSEKFEIVETVCNGDGEKLNIGAFKALGDVQRRGEQGHQQGVDASHGSQTG